MEKFYLDQYLDSGVPTTQAPQIYDFYKLCQRVQQEFMREWEEKDDHYDSALRIQKNAMIGYEKEVSYFKGKIRELIQQFKAESTVYPDWYTSLEDGIYHENWGLAGIAEWFSDGLKGSSSAKIIGNRIYFLENGEMELKRQTMIKERREQLIRAFLLHTPEERLDKDYHEIYMLDGTRVTIYGGTLTKKGQDVIIFRRYIIPIYSFEEQASRGTIPKSAIPLFKAMVRIGFNVAFLGAVRTAKTTFLTTWQSYEDQSLEGVLVETDPEIPLHKLMPDAPILQRIDYILQTYILLKYQRY